MLAKSTRLTATEVRAVVKDGRAVRTGDLSAKYTKGAGSKAAVVVSNKVAKGAVMRNRLRRAAYQTLRTTLPPGRQVVVFLHKPTLNIDDLVMLCSKLS